ncbi:MAG TPA: hypothetical protein VGP82_25500, partial [Ktedonobacterales bacterium]|nr:hypothetical protein [Ktedonobacterales bacterium]
MRTSLEKQGNGGRSRSIRSQEPFLGEMVEDGVTEVGRAHYVIEGGIPLRGEVQLSGAKNAATKLLVSTLLTEDVCSIRNIPRNLGDVSITEDVLAALGTQVTWITDHIARVQTAEVTNSVVPLELGRKNRLAILASGPLLHRIGRAVIPAPGGDRIGPRPINFHLDGLQRMGAVLEARDGLYYFHTD